MRIYHVRVPGPLVVLALVVSIPPFVGLAKRLGENKDAEMLEEVEGKLQGPPKHR